MSLNSYSVSKLMLAGEYSVLFGGSALVATGIRRAHASFSPSNNFNYNFFSRTHHEYIYYKNHILFDAVIHAALYYKIKAKPGSYYIDTSSFYHGHKLGLGSSAAAVVALSRLLLMQHGIADQELLLNIAHKAHKDFSKGLGSGADIAAIVQEQCIKFAFNTPPQALELFWYNDLLWVDTKKSQNTRIFVAKILNIYSRNYDFFTNFIKQSNIACNILEKSLLFDEIISSISELYNLLEELGRLAELDIVSAEHRLIHKVACDYGGSAKPSGAGGGDLSMALLPSSMRATFIKHLEHLGFGVFLAHEL
jgi:phosphomevalonate kinase